METWLLQAGWMKICLTGLNDFPYYKLPYPKSLSNEFGLNEIYPDY